MFLNLSSSTLSN